MRIAILVSKDYGPKTPFKDDLILKGFLNEKGFSVDIVQWDEEIDFSIYSAAIIRSCWDYDKRVDEFLAKMKCISKECMLFNPYDVIKKNSNKKYLFDLKDRGIHIIPMQLVEDVNSISIDKDWDKIVIKPTISASGRNTYRFNRKDMDNIKKVCKDIINMNKEPIIQKYILSIETTGEYSTIVIDGKILFTVNKKPKEGNFLVHHHFGGTFNIVDISNKQIEFINDLISKLDYIPLYMRVDYIEEDGIIYLLELEEIEPGLYISYNEEIAKELSDAILRKIK